MRSIKNLFSFIAFVLCISTTSFAQNTYFSKFHTSPFTLNPALAGLSFNGSFRILSNYRYEYGSQNFETFETSVDFMLPFRRNTYGGGIQFLQDMFTNQAYAVSKFSAIGSYHILLDRYGKQNLSIGTYLNVYRQVDKSLSASGIDKGDPVGNVVSFADYGIGAHWYNVYDRLPFLSGGIAIFKIKQDTAHKLIDENGLHLNVFRLHLHGDARFWLNRSNSVTTRFVYYGYNQNHAVSAGVEYEYFLKLSVLGSRLANKVVTLRKRTSVFGGLYVRFPDGLYVTAGGELLSFRVSISYDIYFSGFNKIIEDDPYYGKGYMRNAFEISIAYRGLVAKRKSRGIRAPKLR
ncbi:MAG TPA: type IX secretion system membrane protein PorP/SprF [Bacteroidetes bacterium]|nr:type IX secretion system membrane protein PorP/SprF [Bacteroidota bacterium]